MQPNATDQGFPIKQDSPVLVVEYPRFASEDSEIKPRPTSLAEIMFGVEYTTNKPKSTSQEENLMEDNLKEKNSENDKENNDKDQQNEKMRALLIFITLALIFIMIEAMLNSLILRLAMRCPPAYVFDLMVDQAIFLVLETIILGFMIFEVKVMGAIILVLEICSRFYCFLLANRLYYFMSRRRVCKGYKGLVIVIKMIRKSPKSARSQSAEPSTTLLEIMNESLMK